MVEYTYKKEDYRPGAVIDLGRDNIRERFGIIISPEEYERLGGNDPYFSPQNFEMMRKDPQMWVPDFVIYYRRGDKVFHACITSDTTSPKIVTKIEVLKEFDAELNRLEEITGQVTATRKFFLFNV